MVTLWAIIALARASLAEEQVTDISLDSSFSKLDRLVGSLEGGTELFFKGTWDLVYPYEMEIRVGDEKCDVEESYDKVSVVSCLTPPKPKTSETAFKISVFYKNRQIPLTAKAPSVFYYEKLETSYLFFSNPPEQIPRGKSELIGAWVSDDPKDLIEVRIDQLLADIDEQSELEDIKITVGQNTHGDSDLRLRFSEGHSKQIWIGEQTNYKGELYNFRVLANVAYISRKKGGNHGGMPMTISGEGFPTHSYKAEVTIAGNPCKVKLVEEDRIECVTQPETVKEKGPYYTGGAGLLWEAWTGHGEVSVGYAKDYYDPDSSGNVPNPVSVGEYEKDVVARYYGYFVPPYDGDYTFYASTGDALELFMSPDRNQDKMQSVIRTDEKVEQRQYFVEKVNESVKLPMKAGEIHYLEAHYYSKSGSAHFSVGVETPLSKDKRGNEMPLVQRLHKVYDEIYTPASEKYQMHLVEVYGNTQPPDGGKIRFRAGSDSKITDYVDWDYNSDSWSCKDIEQAFAEIKVDITCKTWKEYSSIFYEFFVPDPKVVYERIDVDTYYATPLWNVQGRTRSKEVEMPGASQEVKYWIEFGNEKSSTFYMTVSAKELQNQLNKEIEGFKYDLLVYTYNTKDASYFYFLLPGSLFKDNNLFLRLGREVGSYSTELETLEIIKKPGESEFWWVIPSDFLRTAEKKPQVSVAFDGSYAVCTRDCGFTYEESPTISSFSLDKDILLVERSEKLPDDELLLTITVGEIECEIQFMDRESYKCKLKEGEVGKHQPVVVEKLTGYLPISPDFKETIDFQLRIDNVTPEIGGDKGGTYLTIKGTGFSASIERAKKLAKVTIGNSPCEIWESSVDEIVCVTSPQTTDSVIRVEVNGYTTEFNKFEYSSQFNLEVEDIKPDYASSVFTTYISIRGNNFGFEKKDLKVMIGETECYVSKAEGNELSCTYYGGPKGLQDVVVYRAGIGEAWKEKYPVLFKVDSLSTTVGSVYGGTRLIIKGAGFMPEGLDVHRVTIDTAAECEVLEIPDEFTLICETPEMPTTYFVGQSYEMKVLARLQEVADCFADCSFTWSSYMSPEVESMSPQRGTAGTIVTLKGEYFGEYDGYAELKFNDKLAKIQSVDDFEIVAVVPSVQGSQPQVTLNILDKGDASIDVQFFNQFAVEYVEPRKVSQGGGKIKIFGSGFHPQMEITFGSMPCEIGDLTDEYYECILKPSSQGGLLNLSLEDTRQSFKCQDSSKCAIEFSQAATPFISGTSNNLRISGSFPSKPTEVTLGDYQCRVTEASASSIQCTPEAPAGEYLIKVYFEGYGYAMGNIYHKVELSVDKTSAVESSFAGGRLVEFEGSGLTVESKVTICGRDAEVLKSTGDYMTISTPQMPTVFSQKEFRIVYDEVEVTRFWYIGQDMQKVSEAFDDDLDTFYTDTAEDKWVGLDAGQSILLQLFKVDIVPGGMNRRQYRALKGSEIQGSDDGQNWMTLFVYDHVDDRKNQFVPKQDAQPVFRMYRIFKAKAEPLWAINEFKVYGALLLNHQSSKLTCDVVIASMDGTDEKRLSGLVSYSAAETPVLYEITPKRGSALGGEKVTFKGSGFLSGKGEVTVKIDEVECRVTSVTNQLIECTTGARRIYMESKLEIWIGGKGYVATYGLTYLYSELWSDPRTWGGVAPPKKGESVYIAPGQVVILDIPTPLLQILTVEGTLIVADLPGLSIDAEIILVHYGKLIIGTEEDPFLNEIKITLHGGISTKVASVFGNKMIIAISGSIDIYGKPRKPTWTLMQKGARAGESIIELVDDVDWKAGEYIAIAPSSFNYWEGETHRIADVQGRKIYLNEPLRYDHYSDIETYGKDQIDMRTEVGLLTRNIKILSNKMDLDDRLYGTHILMSVASEPVNGRIAYTEFYRAGQGFRRLKYPLHYHIPGLLTDSYARGNAFHQCYNRAITVHGATYAVIEDNVAFDVMGHTYFIEDGNETKNVFRNNLAIMTKQSFSLLNTDRTPAAIWISNPDNFIYDNRVAGCSYYGIWYDLPEAPPVFGFGDAPPVVCTEYLEFGSFERNLAHSNGLHGLRIEPRQIPLTRPCDEPVDRSHKDWWKTNPAITAYFDGFTAFKNGESGLEAHEIGDIRFSALRLADNRLNGLQIGWSNFSEPFNSARVTDAVIVGRSIYNDKEMKGFVGVKTPQTDGMLFDDIRFYNIESDMYALGDSLFAELPRVADYGARLHKLSRLQFFNARRAIKWNAPFRGIYEVLDESLTGYKGDFVAAPWEHLFVPQCRYDTEIGMICRGAKIRRVHFHDLKPLTRFFHQPIKIQAFDERSTAKGDFSSLPMIVTDQKKDIKYSWAVPFVTGNSYHVHWGSHPIDWDAMHVEIDTFEEDEYVKLVFNVTDSRDNYFLRRGPSVDYQSGEDPTILKRVSERLNEEHPAGTYRWKEGVFELIVSGRPANEYQFNDIEISANRCPDTGCNLLQPLPPPGGKMPERRWSDASRWPNKEVPKEGDYVVIAQGETVILDVYTPVLKYIEINGELIFDEEKSATLSSELVFIRAGKVRSGSKNKPTNGWLVHSIVLYGGAYAEDFEIRKDIDVGNQALINTGVLEMYGFATRGWTTLEQNVKPGDEFIFVKYAQWPVDKYIGLAPTGFDGGESEVFRITKVENNVENDPDWKLKEAERKTGKGKETDDAFDIPDGNPEDVVKIYLDRKVEFYHAGSEFVVGKKEIDMRGEVAILERNVRILGGEKDWECSVLTTSFDDKDTYGNTVTRSGSTILDNVEIGLCGQIDSEKAALRFEENTEGASIVNASVLSRSAGWGLLVKNANNIEFSNNVLFRMNWRSIVVTKTMDSSMKNNLIIDTRRRPKVLPNIDKVTAFYACVEPFSCIRTEIKYNRAAGYIFAGFILSENLCGSSNMFVGNVAHSGYVGWILSNKNSFCVSPSDFSAYFNELGVTAMTQTRQLLYSKMILVENKVGLAIRTGVEANFLAPFDFAQNVTSFLIAGKSPHSYCDSNDCSYTDCGRRIGFYTGFADAESEAVVHYNEAIDLPIPVQRDFAHTLGQAFYDWILLAHFTPDLACNAPIHAFETNPDVPDFTLPHFFSNFEKINVHEDSLVYMNDPNPIWESVDYCGNLVCTGLWNVLIEDRDGSVIGQKQTDKGKTKGGVILPNNPGIASKSICKFFKKNNAYICHYEPDQKDFYEIYVYEETFGVGITTSPVNITSIGQSFQSFKGSGFSNDLNALMDHKFEGEANAQAHLRVFPSIAYTGLKYNLTFFGTQAIFGGCYLQGTLGRNLSITMTHDVQDSRVYTVSEGVNPIFDISEIVGFYRYPDLNDPHGTNRWYTEDLQVEIVLREETSLGIRAGGFIRSSRLVNYVVADFSQNFNNHPYEDMSATIIGVDIYEVRIPVVDAIDPEYQLLLLRDVPENVFVGPVFGEADEDDGAGDQGAGDQGAGDQGADDQGADDQATEDGETTWDGNATGEGPPEGVGGPPQ